MQKISNKALAKRIRQAWKSSEDAKAAIFAANLWGYDAKFSDIVRKLGEKHKLCKAWGKCLEKCTILEAEARHRVGPVSTSILPTILETAARRRSVA